MDAEACPDLVHYADLADAGLTRYRMERLVEQGSYERIAPGTFLHAGTVDDTTAARMAVARRKPEATLCLLTALSLHDLTDEIPRSSDIALPRGTHPLTVHYAPITWHTFAAGTFTIGRTDYALPSGTSIGLYGPERTLIDVFRLRHEWGADMATAALKRWLNRRGNTPSTLLGMARQFPAARPALQAALEVLL